MNELVRLTTQDVGKGMAITDSWIVSEHFNKRHTDVIRSIENLITQNCELKNMFCTTNSKKNIATHVRNFKQ